MKSSFLLHLSLLTISAGLLVGLSACGGDPPHGVADRAFVNNPIRYVVVIFQENRTPDNLFHDPILIARGADIARSGLNSRGETVPMGELGLDDAYDPIHSHQAFLDMYDGGRMDGADKIPAFCRNCTPVADPQFRYVKRSQVRPYFAMAEQYTFGDRMFQTNQGPSFPAHQFIISGTSAPSAHSKLFAEGNPQGPSAAKVGCLAPAGMHIELIAPSGKEIRTEDICFEHPVLSDLLEAQGISWRYYAPSQGWMWTAPNAIRHICQPEMQDGQLNCTGNSWNNVVIPQTQVLLDIAQNQLAQVSWVIPDGKASDHPPGDGSGPSWVASIVNAIGNSPYWAHTAIFITWDDWGGWYDHVPPKIINSYEYGFRVPLIVVSPYAKRGYISHVTHDFGSILKYIEELYGLKSLGYADALADDLSDCFDLNQTPTKFHTIAAPLDAKHFLEDRRPATDPDDD